jgi:hypothetical protein
LLGLALVLSAPGSRAATNAPFVGHITATLTQGDQALPLLFTVGTNAIRAEITDTLRPHPINLRDRHSEALILVFPHNRSFVRLPLATPPPTQPGPAGLPSFPMPASGAPGLPGGPSAPPVIGPTNLPGVPPVSLPAPPPGAPAGLPPGIGPQAGGPPGLNAGPGMSALPMMPMMPPMMEAAPELRPTGQTTNLLGYACRQFELAQRGQRLEIWATDRLLPFPGYLRQQPHRFGPQMVEEQWPELLRAKKLFPMQVSLDGCVRLAVTAVTPEQVKDETQTLFQPPADYHELEPLPF